MILALGSVSLEAQALGVERVANNTTLGQPLDFAATLRLEPDEVVTPDCVDAEVVVGERLLPPQAVRVILAGEPGARERRVRVSTLPAVDEPVVSVTLKVGCPTVLSRTFVAFVDPPAINLAQSPAPAPAPQAAAPTMIPAPMPPASVQGSDRVAAPEGASAGLSPAPAQPPVAVAPARRVERPVQRPPVAPEGRPAPAPRVTQARPAPSGPRLRLDPAAPLAAEPPVPAEAPAPPVDQAAEAAAAEAAARREADEAALRALEQSLTALRNEALSTQRSVAILQARLAAAEAQRYQNWLVYSLAAAVLLLAIALLVTVQRLRQMRREPGWWSASSQAAAVPESERREGPASELADAAAGSVSPMSTQPAAATAIGGAGTASLPYLRPPAEAIKAAGPALAAEPRREVTVEELIDLEQQADFFIVLGQDEAAIDVLMGHLRSSGGASPLPYLKLLEIYRRRGDREAYERVRDRFNRRFSAYAPEWGNDLQQGRSLEDYPERLAALQTLWTQPAQAMESLEALLLRQEQGGETFDLPAYREILFLYAIARDLAEHEVPETVDLLLPIGEEGLAGSRSGAALGRPSGGASAPAAAPAPDFERSERYDVDFQFGSGASLTGTGSRGDTPRKK
jgi:hypothetical protein